VSGDIEISSDVTLDLNYHTLDGNISVSEYIRFEISDNSDGEGTLTGEILPGDGALVTLSGGAYAYDTAVKFKDETFVLFQRYDGYYLLMTEDEAMERCGVYILNGDGKAYYETIYGAVGAFTDGDTIYLNADTSFTAVIEKALVIDVGCYTLTLDVEIEADESGTLGAGGSLTLIGGEGFGKVKGEIIVSGLGDASMDVNSYTETLVLKGGLTPSENLSVDLTNLSNSSNGGYFFSKVNEGDTYYRVAAAFEHVTHEYEIEVWGLDENGSLVLYLMCACGLYESDVYGVKTGYISADFEIDVSDGIVTYEGTAVDGEGKVHEYFSTFEYVASISLSNGVTLYFESLYTALDYSSAHGGTIKLEKDVREDVTAWDKGLIIDLNGHTLEGAVTLLAGSSMTLQNTSDEKGTLKSTITSSGTLTLKGNLDVVFTGDAYGSERGRIIISGEVNFNLSGHTFTGAPEFEDGTTFTISGGDFVLVWDVSMQDGVTMVVSGDVNMDLSGYDFSGKIEVEEGATLVVTDSSSAQSGSLEGNVSAGAGAFVEMRRGVVDISDIVSGNLAVETAEGYVFESAAQDDGETFYRIVTKDAHISSGHGLDIEMGVWEFDPGYSILTVHFRCLCEEETEQSFYLSEDYYSSYVEYEPYEELLPDGTTQTIMLSQWVVVSYEISSSVTGPNGVTYTFTAYGDVLLPGFNEEGDGYYIIPGYEEYYVGDELCGYRYTCIQEAGCNVTGVDM
ncbi:MAG: hypothetical protein LUD29_06035, partial [Clostridia bacterium]|nr:hypothetical protein [Clostridia bacterium]